jgi:hypothetical protein
MSEASGGGVLMERRKRIFGGFFTLCLFTLVWNAGFPYLMDYYAFPSLLSCLFLIKSAFTPRSSSLVPFFGSTPFFAPEHHVTVRHLWSSCSLSLPTMH